MMDAKTRADELASATRQSLCAAFAGAARTDEPYPHWMVDKVLPAAIVDALHDLPLPAVGVDGVSGKRELHNDTRRYFDALNNARFEACAAVSAAFQSPQVVRAIVAATGADLAGSYVRLEYAQDVDGFWLEPHTDLGVKKFTMLIYLTRSPEQSDLGTDIYSDHETWAKRTPYRDNTALIFVPGDNTWHGLARRPIAGVRKTVIMNYVSDGWRARDQLAWPTTPVLA
jgi:hypothetical protein